MQKYGKYLLLIIMVIKLCNWHIHNVKQSRKNGKHDNTQLNVLKILKNFSNN